MARRTLLNNLPSTASGVQQPCSRLIVRIRPTPRWAAPHFPISMWMRFRRCNQTQASCPPTLVMVGRAIQMLFQSPAPIRSTAACLNFFATRHSTHEIISTIPAQSVTGGFRPLSAMSSVSPTVGRLWFQESITGADALTTSGNIKVFGRCSEPLRFYRFQRLLSVRESIRRRIRVTLSWFL